MFQIGMQKPLNQRVWMAPDFLRRANGYYVSFINNGDTIGNSISQIAIMGDDQ